MAKAAAQIGVSQPTVSEAISDLEHLFAVRLFDRSTRGVELTVYGRALFKRSVAAFDELKQSGRDIEYLADPTVGELRIGCQESVAPAVLLPAIKQFSAKFPKVVIHVDDVPTAEHQLSELRARNYDLMLGRISQSLANEEDIKVEILFHDYLVVAANAESRWANRERINLTELVDQNWVLTPPGTWNYTRLAEAFQARGLGMPKSRLITLSALLRTHLLSDGQYITAFANSMLSINANRYGLKALPVDLGDPPWPVVIITLKNRTLSSPAERFIDCVRNHARSIAARSAKHQ